MFLRSDLPDGDPRITALALERARTLVAPLIVLGMVLAFVVSIPSGIPLPSVVVVANAVLIGIGTFGWVGLAKRRISSRHAHATMAGMWLLAPLNTSLALFVTRESSLAFPFLVELALASTFFLSLRWLVGSLVLAGTVWTSLALRDTGPDTAVQLLSASAMGVCSVLIASRLRRSIDTALLRQEKQERTAALLERELGERLRAEREAERMRDNFVRAQRLEATGTLAAGLAHDMNNILGVVLAEGELLKTDATPETLRAAQAIVTEAERGAQLTRSLLAYARQSPYQRRLVGLDDTLRGVAPVLTRLLPKRIAIEWQVGTTDAVEGDPAEVQQTLVNLCINAADAIEGVGAITISSDHVALGAAAAERLELPAGEYARFGVRDTGAGMSEAVRARIFEPFFTTKPLGKGTGLGLAMVYGTVRAHGGAVDVESREGSGSTFYVYLPAKTGEPSAPELRARATTAASDAAVVLVVDDEPGLRSVTARVLSRMGLSVLTASDGQEAVEVFAAQGASISLVLLDMSMPVMGGAECFAQLRKHRDVPVLLVSGYADSAEVQRLLAEPGVAFIVKPFRPDVLSDKVRALLDPTPPGIEPESPSAAAITPERCVCGG